MTSGPRHPTRITIVDDHALFAESLALTLEAEGYPVKRLDLAAGPMSIAAIQAAALRTMPQIVLLDLDLGRAGDGTAMVEPLARQGIAVIVVTASSDLSRWGDCLRRGARTVLGKSSPLEQVVTCVRRARDGLPLMSVEERARLIGLAVDVRSEVRDILDRLDRLTQREQEILGALMRGEQVRQIARESVVSEATVRTQVKSILAKMETNSQLGAVGAAHRVGWHLPED